MNVLCKNATKASYWVCSLFFVPRSVLEECSVPFLVLFSRNVAGFHSVFLLGWSQDKSSLLVPFLGRVPEEHSGNIPGTLGFHPGPWGFTSHPSFR